MAQGQRDDEKGACDGWQSGKERAQADIEIEEKYNGVVTGKENENFITRKVSRGQVAGKDSQGNIQSKYGKE